MAAAVARSAPISYGDYAFELKWDGFRALVSRNGDYRLRSRRGWNITALLPELADLPAAASFNGELVAFADGQPHFPLVCDRLGHRDMSIALTYVIIDLLSVDGESTMRLPYCERRELLDWVKLGTARGSSRRRSMTAKPSSLRSASKASRASSPRPAASPTVPMTGRGSSPRTAPTGATARN